MGPYIVAARSALYMALVGSRRARNFLCNSAPRLQEKVIPTSVEVKGRMNLRNAMLNDLRKGIIIP